MADALREIEMFENTCASEAVPHVAKAPGNVPVDQQLARRWVRQAWIAKHFTCAICTEPMLEPTRAPCGHDFCRACLETWLASSETCPLDRSIVTRATCHADRIVENIMLDEPVLCAHARLGCPWQGALRELRSHVETVCTCNPAKMPSYIALSAAVADTAGLEEMDDDAENAAPPSPAVMPLRMRLFARGDRGLLDEFFAATS